MYSFPQRKKTEKRKRNEKESSRERVKRKKRERIKEVCSLFYNSNKLFIGIVTYLPESRFPKFFSKTKRRVS